MAPNYEPFDSALAVTLGLPEPDPAAAAMAPN
jgi:hypothetical protein